MGWPESNEGIGGKAFDEHDLLQPQTSTHEKTLIETSLKNGQTTKYFVQQSSLEGYGPYEVRIPSMGDQWTDLTSGMMYGEFQIKKVAGGSEVDATNGDDYSVINLPANSLFKNIELYVGNTNVCDQSTSNYHYK